MSIYNSIIDKKWDGSLLEETQKIFLSISVSEATGEPLLLVSVDSPFYNNPAPTAPPSSSLDGLWNYEVVEFFIKGKLDKYIEMEMGPHGHYLILAFDGYRQCFKRAIEPISYQAQISEDGTRWTGRLVVSMDILPPSTGIPNALFSYNAYALYDDPDRQYCCAYPPVAKNYPTYENPDFHRLELFQKLSLDFAVPSPKSLWVTRQGLNVVDRAVAKSSDEEGELTGSPMVRE